jgi:outer membrane protein
MKQFVLCISLSSYFVAVSAITALGQSPEPTVKIGYADVEYILLRLPDVKQAEANLNAVEKQLTDLVNKKTEELKSKYDVFTKTEKDMLEAARKNTINELQQMQGNLEQLKQDSQTTLEKKHAELMKPVYEKIGKAIEAVAKAEGFTFVLNGHVSGQDVVMYGDPRFDVSDLILKKLGVTPKAPTEIKK